MRRRPFAAAALVIAGLLFLALLIAWTIRFRVATGIVNRKLAAAHVPASYRLTRIGPFHERMEDVRIGDPAQPDLVARRIDVLLGYSLAGPSVRAIEVDGVRLRATLDRNGLRLGALDRLMPKSTGGATKLPDLDLALSDVGLLLATPNGAIQAALAGKGNPQHAFKGTAQVSADALRLASCGVTDVAADLRIAAQSGRPQANGPVRIGSLRCPRLALGAGGLTLALSGDATFDRLALHAVLDGFAGQAGPARFVAVEGPVDASGRIGDLSASARLRLRSLALPTAAKTIARSGTMMAGSPIGPTGAKASAAIARLLSDADAKAELTAAIHGIQTDVRVRQLDLTGRDGAHVAVTEHDGLSWTARGLRTDADIVTGGGALPAIHATLRQSTPGAPLNGVASLASYRAGSAQLATTPVRFRWNGRAAIVDGSLLIDGPIGDGFVQGLAVPVRGQIDSSGALAIGGGCQTIAFRALRLASFSFDGASLPICGQPVVTRSAAGALRIAATSAGAVRLTGRTSGGAPVQVGADRLSLTQAGFSAQGATAAIGQPAHSTHFAAATLDGQIGGGGIGGNFAGTSGAIANVPLNITDAAGRWRFAGSTLQLDGNLRVSDAAESARFNPLATDDARLELKGNVISAAATLREPSSKAEVTRATITHDLSAGSGHALLDVPGITFATKGLQPEKLTPLTLGVIANVVGTVSGNGRIDWGADGVTSSGTFGTDRIDLAAAFGPVTGIKGQIHFTDLLGLVTAPHQEATIAEINPGVSVTNGLVHYQLTGASRVQVEDATWPFAGGTLRLDPSLLEFDEHAERHLTFRVDALDAAAFVQQLDFPNIAATGTFDGVLPMIFDHEGGRIEKGVLRARPGGGTLAYVGELSNARLGTMGKLAFDALKAIRYSNLEISMDGRLDGEMISRVRFTGVRQATAEQGIVARMIRNLPFRFNIQIRAPFRGLVGSARAYIDPRLLLTPDRLKAATPAEPAVQSPASGAVR